MTNAKTELVRWCPAANWLQEVELASFAVDRRVARVVFRPILTSVEINICYWLENVLEQQETT